MENTKLLVKCIILSKKNFGEGHIIMTILTDSYGVIKASAFGGQRLSKRFKGNLDYFKLIEAELELKNKNGDNIFSISSVKNLIHDFRPLSLNIQKFAAASYMQELCSIILTPNEATGKNNTSYLKELYAALCKLETADSTEAAITVIYDFCINLYTDTGFLPEIKRMCGIKKMMGHLEEFNSRILGITPKSFTVLSDVTDQ